VTRTPWIRIVFGLLAAVALGAAVWIVSLPNMAECRASGREVDSTERHCDSASDFVQLQEHATFHAVQVVVMGGVLLAGAYTTYRLFRRWSLRRG
jgi:hypothetical protein